MRVSMRGGPAAGSGARAYKLFEGDRNRNRTPEPDASLAKQEGTVQWKRTDQANSVKLITDAVKRDLFEEVERRP